MDDAASEDDTDDLFVAAGFVHTPEEEPAAPVDPEALRAELAALAAVDVSGRTAWWDGDSSFYASLRDDWAAALASETYASDDVRRAYDDNTPCETLVVAFASCTKAQHARHGGTRAAFEYVGACERLGVAHALFVRDPLQAWYLRRRDGFDAIVDVIAREVAALAPTRVLTVGSSMGGYAAVRAAVELGARHAGLETAAIAFGPQVFVEPLEREALELPSTEFDRELAALKHAGVRLASLVDVVADRKAHVELHCGALARGDVREARLLQQSCEDAAARAQHERQTSFVEVHVHGRCGHCVAGQLHSQGSLDPLLRDWIARRGGASSTDDWRAPSKAAGGACVSDASTEALRDDVDTWSEKTSVGECVPKILDVGTWLRRTAASMPLSSRRQLVGPMPPAGTQWSEGTEGLIGRMYDAQRVCAASLPWWINDKVERKIQWAARGVEEHLLVPTLLSCGLEWDGVSRVPVPEVVWDEASEAFVPNMEAGAPLQQPVDGGAIDRLLALLEAHRTVVLKPARGSNSRGVLLLSVDAPPAHVPDAQGRRPSLECAAAPPTPTPEAQPTGGGDRVTAHTSVWIGTPQKVLGEGHDAAWRLSFAEVWQQLVLQNAELAGPSRCFLAEPAIAHDQELCVLAVDGGRLQLVAGRSLVMDRILMVDGAPEVVAPADFAMTPTMAHVFGEPEDGPTRAHNARRLRTQRLGGDARGRTLLEAMRDVVLALARDGATETAVFRADFFVRWARGDAPAALWINEVEHGFNAACLVGWFGERLTSLALRAWVLAADEEQRKEALREECRPRGHRPT